MGRFPRLKVSPVLLLTLAGVASAEDCCAKLKALYSSKTYYPNTYTYGAANGAGLLPILGNTLQNDFPYWANQGIAAPSCVFIAKSTQDVSNAVKILHQHRCEYAIRSGGHNPIPEWSNTYGGVLLSTSDINDVTYNSAGNTVTFGAGCKWKHVYDKLDPLGVGTMGGRDNTVGTGGFLLGGGISYYSNSRGWTADHITAYEVVYANGTIGTITASNYPDLFTAMKGAGSSFAIVTRFTQTTFQQRTYNAGFVFYPPGSIPKVLNALYNYSVDGAIAHPESHIIPAFTSVGPDLVVTDITLGAFCFFYPTSLAGTQETEVFKPFTKEIPFLYSTKRNRNGLNSISGEIAGYSAPGKRQSFTNMAIVLDSPEILKDLWDAYQTVTEPYRLCISGYTASFIFYPLTSTFVSQGTAAGKKNSMGLEDTPAGQAGQTIMIISINLTWLLKSQDVLAAECVGKAFARLRQIAKQRGVYHPFKYMNYANGTQDVLGGYGAVSGDRLRQVKLEVDPTNDFGTLVKGRYKVPGV
ncbi:uncharacterized protein DFL_004674 [Arthrobotrys flagrans]|uniref:FAD-binding PCMH-type domain-containing protein n=1 Tax=Arthrobotrys flagrans TaxID=97331 RepID=A0A437A5K2_ARTFL|nr:hypothetical protein DFL_004674 [Arthrobotrys flagrans]